MANAADRLLALKAQQATFTGIDFVQVVDVCDQTTLRIYFLTDIQALTRPIDSGAEAISHDDIIIFSPTGGAGVPIVQLDTNVPLTFGSDIEACRDFLEIKVLEPGDFTNYRLRINDPFANTDPLAAPFPRIDPFFNDVEFSFKAGCDDQLDCAPPGPDCPIEDQVDFPVDYLARDFVSFKNALLDFAAQRYPQWEQPTDADVGFMLMEVMAALGDEFSYIQDRHGREAYLETATERRSLRKKARLVDYEIHDGRLASTFLELTTSGATSGLNDGLVAAGSNVYALSDTMPAVVFEIGQGLRDTREYAVRDEWNGGALEPYVFDDSQQCLLIGATELFVAGTILDSNLLVSEEPAEVRRMLLRTEPADPSVPARRILVRITEITEIFDPLFSQTVTRIRWHEDDALRFQLDQNELVISLNVLPATAGETLETMFICAEIGDEPELPSAVEREGPLPRIGGERPTIFLFSLPGTDTGGLGFLGDDVRNPVPEIVLQEVGTGGNEWTWRRSLIGAAPTDEVFTLEDGTWRRIVAHRRLGRELVHRDYAVGTGYTIRFGDTEFGRPPPRGTAFEVLYRLGPGVFANVPAGAIRSLTRADGSGRELPTFVTAASNPLAVIDGVNPESAADIKLLTPEAYRADVLFAVRPEDYGRQAETARPGCSARRERSAGPEAGSPHSSPPTRQARSPSATSGAPSSRP